MLVLAVKFTQEEIDSCRSAMDTALKQAKQTANNMSVAASATINMYAGFRKVLLRSKHI